jgi:16S rRNA (guanine966-N2)-methyltransferase
MTRGKKPSARPGQLRIIGGQWRGRKLSFPAVDGLRPTSDRVRETLFNWLAPVVPGARCLDLFSGSGALGLEALSRGAAHCDFVDSSNAALGQIAKHLETLGASDRGQCHTLSAMQFLQQATTAYDVVFIDPPFSSDLVNTSCSALAEGQLLAPGAHIYLETRGSETAPQTPGNWALHRDKRAGDVAYRLFIVGEG